MKKNCWTFVGRHVAFINYVFSCYYLKLSIVQIIQLKPYGWVFFYLYSCDVGIIDDWIKKKSIHFLHQLTFKRHKWPWHQTKNKKSLTVTLYGRLWTIVLILGYGVYSLMLDPMLMMGAVEYLIFKCLWQISFLLKNWRNRNAKLLYFS